MKKFFKLATLSLMVVLLVTGCGMKEEFGIKIGKDKKVTLEILVAQDDEMIDAMLDMGSSDSDGTKKHTDKERWEYVDSSDSSDSFKDYKKTKYDKDGYKGYTYTLELGDIDELVSDGDKADLTAIGEDSKIFTKKGDVYSLNTELSTEDTKEMEQYASSVDLDIKLKVTLPNKAKSNNATKVTGTTYIWDLTKAKSIDLSFDFSGKGASSSNNNIIMIAGGACAVIGIAICVVALTKKKQAQ